MNASTLVLSTSQWLNTESAISLEQLKGRVVIVSAFQMLCPGCVAHSIPQLKKLYELSRDLPLTVIGLHTVFEHHQAMQPHALKAFAHEYRLNFPIGIDAYEENSAMPKTMTDWQMRGTPSTFVFSPDGELRLHQFGHLDDLALGLFIGQLFNTASTPKQKTEESSS